MATETLFGPAEFVAEVAALPTTAEYVATVGQARTQDELERAMDAMITGARQLFGGPPLARQLFGGPPL